MYEFRIASELQASPETVWQSASTMAGVNEELAPVVRMTLPNALVNASIADVPLGKTWFSSWILLFGIIPVDLHQLRVDELVRYGFRENSSSAMHIYWKHNRTIEPFATGSRITDHVTFQPRIPFLGYLLKPIFEFVFRNRHRNLKRKFNG